MEDIKNGPAATPPKKRASKQTALEKKMRKEGFYDCKKLRLKRDGAGNVLGIGELIREPKAIHESNINEFNLQQCNSGLILMKVDAEYKIMDVVVGTASFEGTVIEKTKKMYVELKK